MNAVMLRSTHIAFPNWLWYWWGEQKNITGYGAAHLVRSTCQDAGLVCFLPLDLIPAGAGDKEPGRQTRDGAFTRIALDKYFGSATAPPVVIPDPPPVIIVPPVTPPDEPPPPVVPPDNEPIELPTPTYKINIAHPPGSVSTLVGNWQFGNGLEVALTSPTGTRQTARTGDKPEWGAGGFEAGWVYVVGNYKLTIAGNEFILPCDGKPTRVTFEAVTAPVTDTPVVLRSGWMIMAKAGALLLKLQELYRDVFRIE